METTEVMAIVVMIAFIVGVFVGYSWQFFNKDDNKPEDGHDKTQD